MSRRPPYLSEILARLISRIGFNPNRVCEECKDVGGFLLFVKSDILHTSPSERWKSYGFMDGSSVDIYLNYMVVNEGIPCTLEEKLKELNRENMPVVSSTTKETPVYTYH